MRVRRTKINPNLKARNPKQIQMTKAETTGASAGNNSLISIHALFYHTFFYFFRCAGAVTIFYEKNF